MFPCNKEHSVRAYLDTIQMTLGGTIGKHLKKKSSLFKTKGQVFIQLFPYSPPYDFFHLLVPQRKQKNWPKCHSSQSVTGQKVTSQKDTGQTVSPAKVSLAKVSLAKVSLTKLSLAKRSLCPKCHSGQSVPAKVSLAKVSFWPKCDSALKMQCANSVSADAFSVKIDR